MKPPLKKTSALPTWLSVAVVALSLAATGCSDGDGADAGEPVVERESFDSFTQFMDRAGPAGSTAPGGHQVVMIGIDGATWRALDPLIAQGRLPNLERIRMEGCYGTLLSTACFVSPPAWVSMLSGYSPVQSGLYTFGNFSWEAGKFTPVTAEDVTVPSVWDVASRAGHKVAVTNVPITYPVRPVNGIMVSGLMTPVPVSNRLALEPTEFSGDLSLSQVAPDVQSHSIPVKSEGSDSLNTFLWWRIDSTDNGVTDYDRVVLTVYPRLEGITPGEPGRVYDFELDRYSPWIEVRGVYKDTVWDGWCKFLLYRVEDGGVRARTSQVLFDVAEVTGQYTYPKELAGELADRFEYYMPSKSLKPDVVPSVTLETVKYADFFYDYDDWDLFYYVFTQADNIQHVQGFSAGTAKVYEIIDGFLGRLMKRLPDDCTLIITSDHGFKKFKWGVDINESLEQLGLLVRVDEESNEIDYKRSTVFHNMWHLYFNPKLITRDHLASLGVPVEGERSPRDALINYLQTVMVFTDGTTDFPLEFTPLPQSLPNDHPDMVVKGAYDTYMVEFWNLMRPRGRMMWELMDTEQNNHEREGVYLIWGNHIRTGIDTGVKNIEDIAPTMLYSLGLPVAENMDGRVMFEVFHEPYLAQNPLIVVPDYNEIDRQFVAVEEDTEPLEKKLKALGYAQ